jgi:hypothetical protein
MLMSEDEKPPWWVEFTKSVGFPSAMLLMMTYGAFMSLRWYATEIMVPQAKHQTDVLNKTVLFIDKTSEFMDQLASDQKVNAVKLGGQSEHAVQMLQVTTEIDKTTKSTNKLVELEAERSKTISEKMLKSLQDIDENTKKQ